MSFIHVGLEKGKIFQIFNSVYFSNDRITDSFYFYRFLTFKMCYYEHTFYNEIQVNKNFNVPVRTAQQMEK